MVVEIELPFMAVVDDEGSLEVIFVEKEFLEKMEILGIILISVEGRKLINVFTVLTDS